MSDDDTPPRANPSIRRRDLVLGIGAGAIAGFTASQVGSRAAAGYSRAASAGDGGARSTGSVLHLMNQANIRAEREPCLVLAGFRLADTDNALPAVLTRWRRLIDGANDRTRADAFTEAVLSSTYPVAASTTTNLVIGWGNNIVAQFRGDPARFPEAGGTPTGRRGNPDLIVQACSPSSVHAWAAVRALSLAAAAKAEQLWAHHGTVETSSPSTAPRNGFGFQDGMVDTAGSSAPPQTSYWDGSADATFMDYIKIRMNTSSWDLENQSRQEQIIGRERTSGAALKPDGAPSHVRAMAQLRGSSSILRRPYSYAYGPSADGTPDSGLHFISFSRDPSLVDRLADHVRGPDPLSTYLTFEAHHRFLIPSEPLPKLA